MRWPTYIVLVASRLAFGQPLLETEVAPTPTDATTPAPAEPRAPVTAADVADDPLPGQESGRADAVDDGDTVGRKVGRVALTPLRWSTDLLLFPVRGTLWLQDRYHLDQIYTRIFYNDAKTIGLYPTFAFESGFGVTGVTGGARFVARDLFGHKEHLSLEAAAGAAYWFRQLYSAGFRTGDLLGKRASLELDGGYELRPRDVFYGVGNALMPETRYSQERSRALVTGDVRVWSELHVRPAAAIAKRTFGAPSQGTPTEDLYMPVGFASGYSSAYGEVELRWDDRQSVGAWDPRGMYTGGSLAAAFVGRFDRLDPGPGFWRYGFDLQHFFRLGIGPRTLLVRVRGEGVTGTAEEVPFTELPTLGGSTYLRGYELDQFRDRIAALGTVAYGWDLSSWMTANLFADAGRVYDHLHALTLEGMRVGYGLGLDLHHGGDFVTELSLASSIDGGFYVNLSFNPVYDLDERVRRR
jgi:hypothetical protein